MQYTVEEVAKFVQARVVGSAGVELSGVASITRAEAGDLVFVEDEKHLASALASRASAILAGEFAAGTAAGGKALLISRQPKLAFARAAGMLCPRQKRPPGIHAGAAVDESARLGRNVYIGARAVIGERAEIGEGSSIAAGSVIGAGVTIGRDCEIYPNVTIYSGSRLGDRVIVHAGAVLGSDGFGYVRDAADGHYEKFPQNGKLEIGDDVEIGANATVDRGALEVTRIGRGTKIDNLVHVGHNCQIGEDVVIAAQTGFSGSVTVQNGVVLGGQVGVGEHARIEEGVMLGGQGGVLPGKVLRGKGIVFWGTPAQPLRQYLKQLAALGKLARK